MSDSYSNEPQTERTAFTLRALDFSTIFNAYFKNRPVGGDMVRIAMVVEPEGMSTGKGEAARQPIVLNAELPGHKAIAVGWVDTAKDKAHLRTYDYLVQQHAARHGSAKFGLGQTGYNAFFREAMKYMHDQGVACTTDQVFTGSTATITRKSGLKPRSNPWVVAGAAVAAVILAGLVFYFLFKS